MSSGENAMGETKQRRLASVIRHEVILRIVLIPHSVPINICPQAPIKFQVLEWILEKPE